ncbi:MAG: Spy/CpxP family protein refolding chaperone [Thermodesulfobacteriota bacterium]|jgi:Spy/CpxP family protein refolding chaperone|nr:MAG: Spy/CpxP family protein refolding chaperone [Thermodesulfobacteriota bacterium]
MNKPKLIGGLLLVFILGALAGVWGNQLYFIHKIKHRFERFAEGGPMPFMLGHRMGGFGGGWQPPCMFEHIMDGCGKIINELDLTADQKKKVDDILTKNQDERKKLIESLREAQQQLNTVVSAKEFDENAFRKCFQQVSSNKENLALLRTKMIPELKAVLSPEQVGYLKGRIEARKEFCEKSRWGSRPGHHGAFAEPHMTPQPPPEQGD